MVGYTRGALEEMSGGHWGFLLVGAFQIIEHSEHDVVETERLGLACGSRLSGHQTRNLPLHA